MTVRTNYSKQIISSKLDDIKINKVKDNEENSTKLEKSPEKREGENIDKNNNTPNKTKMNLLKTIRINDNYNSQRFSAFGGSFSKTNINNQILGDNSITPNETSQKFSKSPSKVTFDKNAKVLFVNKKINYIYFSI